MGAVTGGSISTGTTAAETEMIGADLAYLGIRFPETRECAVSGVPASFVAGSLRAAGIDLAAEARPWIDLSLEPAGT